MKDETKSLFVSIVGKPNAGKSSLINMLINSKISIVSPKPQTTRNKITGILTEDNIQLVFIDTPGLHKSFNKLSDYMISEIDSSFSGIELSLHVVDVLKKSIDTTTIEKLKKYNTKAILAINKIDALKNKSEIIEIIDKYRKLFNYEAIIPISAKNSDGRDDLLNELKSRAVPSNFFFSEDDITDQTVKSIVGEIVREKLLYFLDKELPHGTAVQVEKFKELPNNEVTINAVIYCEKQNHKSIIIGSRGSMIKKIGVSARKSISDFIECKVNLKLFVKVRENWRNSMSVLHDLGYV